MMKVIKIINGDVITPYRVIPRGTVLLKDGFIAAVAERDLDAPDAFVIDAAGKYVAPGFIDMHVHGGGGADFMDGSLQGFLQIAEMHASFGTTSMFPTTLTSSVAALYESFEVYRAACQQNVKGARFSGLHLERPYFAMDQRGAQAPQYIRDPDPAEYEEILAATDIIKRWSAAPELKGGLAFGRALRKKGIVAAIAHTDAVYEEVVEAVENGYTLATHLYSGMSGVTRRNAFRYAGAVESAFIIDEMDVEIIADGIHLPAPLLKLVYKIKGPDRIALITDAMRGAGMPPGESVLGNIHTGLNVIIEDGVAKLPDRSAFAGSVATMDRLVRNMVQLAGVPLIDAVKMATATPARIMKVDGRVGSIAEGKEADIVIFDKEIEVSMTIIGGRVVYG